jgi:hypothetical protein
MIASLKPGSYRYDACDIGNPGFIVRIYPGGIKSWVYRYRIKDTVRLMHLGRTSYMNCATAKRLYHTARKERLSGVDPQGIHPVTREAEEFLIELWLPYETTGQPPEVLSRPVSVEDLSAHYGVSPASVNKLIAYRYLGTRDNNGKLFVYPIHDAIRNMVNDGSRLR